MKKMIILLTIFTVLFLLSSCNLFIVEEDSDAFRDLNEQYTNFIEHDVLEFEDFVDVMNEATETTTLSVFMIEARILDVFNHFKASHYTTGVVVYQDLHYFYLVSTGDHLEPTEKNVDYYGYDAYGNEQRGVMVSYDETVNLALYRFRILDTYPVIEYATHKPMDNELALLISNQYPKQNIMTLSLFYTMNNQLHIDEVVTDDLMSTPVFDIQLDFVGLLAQTETGVSYIIDYEVIDLFISNTLDY